jgi:hypothetical protein
MAYQKLQVGVGIPVVPSNTIDIPNAPGGLFSGTIANITTETITVTGAEFLAMNFRPGMVVQSTVASPAVATIVSVDSDTKITLSTGAGFTNGDTFEIFTDPNVGCVLYVGVGGDLRVLTASDSDITLVGVVAGSFIPIQVKRVFSTSTAASSIVALW